MPYGDIDLGQVSIGSGNGLLPDGTKPLPEPWHIYLKTPISNKWNFLFLKWHPDLSRANELTRHFMIIFQDQIRNSYFLASRGGHVRPLWFYLSILWQFVMRESSHLSKLPPEKIATYSICCIPCVCLWMLGTIGEWPISSLSTTFIFRKPKKKQ